MKINTAFIFIIIIIACNSDKKSKVDMAEIKFLKDTLNFVKIEKGDSLKAVFPFQNTSTVDLAIKKIGASCGCTNAYTTKEIISPGQIGSINVSYNSGEDTGMVLKTIVVESNTSPALKVLYITGKVE